MGNYVFIILMLCCLFLGTDREKGESDYWEGIE